MKLIMRAWPVALIPDFFEFADVFRPSFGANPHDDLESWDRKVHAALYKYPTVPVIPRGPARSALVKPARITLWLALRAQAGRYTLTGESAERGDRPNFEPRAQGRHTGLASSKLELTVLRDVTKLVVRSFAFLKDASRLSR